MVRKIKQNPEADKTREEHPGRIRRMLGRATKPAVVDAVLDKQSETDRLARSVMNRAISVWAQALQSEEDKKGLVKDIDERHKAVTKKVPMDDTLYEVCIFGEFPEDKKGYARLNKITIGKYELDDGIFPRITGVQRGFTIDYTPDAPSEPEDLWGLPNPSTDRIADLSLADSVLEEARKNRPSEAIVKFAVG